MSAKSNKGNEIKTQQLGMPHSTAAGKLRKYIMFDLVQRLNLDTCFQCNKKIKTEKEFSIEHKEPWLHSGEPFKNFFNLNNIAFSHLNCNIGKGRRPHKKDHGTESTYRRGCRCDVCKKATSLKKKAYRARRKERTGFDRKPKISTMVSALV